MSRHGDRAIALDHPGMSSLATNHNPTEVHFRIRQRKSSRHDSASDLRIRKDYRRETSNPQNQDTSIRYPQTSRYRSNVDIRRRSSLQLPEQPLMEQ